MKLIDILVEEWKGEWPSVQGFDFVAQDGSTAGQTVTFFETPPHAYSEHKLMWMYCDGQIEYPSETLAMSSPAALAEDHTTAVITREQYMEHFNARSNKYQKMAINPKNSDDSASIQRQLFEHGYRWYSNRTEVQATTAKWLYTSTDGVIKWGTHLDHGYEGHVCQYYVITRVEFMHPSGCLEINGT